jgi:hypothetical protein
LGDPPITPPTDPSVIPAIPAEFTNPQPALGALHQGAQGEVNRKIRLYQKAAWHWQSLMGLHHTRSSYDSRRVKSVAYANWVLGKWKDLAKQLGATARPWMKHRIADFHQTAAHWTQVIGRNPVSSLDLPRRALAGAGNIEAQFNQWRKVNQAVLEEAANPPHSAEFNCIHHYEGSWTANTGNGYYGGLQMDLTFQGTYGGYLLKTKGTADHWTPLEQKWVAAKAYASGRGFGPWPNTARYCGLL